MKRKLLLGLLPSLLILSSCARVSNEQVAEPKENIPEPAFVEDTEAHDEIFGKVGFGGQSLSVRKLVDVESSAPAIGIQTKEDGANISIRFVAAVNFGENLGTATAKWTRALFGTDGHPISAKYQRAEKPCAKAYDELADTEEDGGSLTIEEFNARTPGTYTHFVVYTLLNIPKSTYKDDFLVAYLTVDLDGEGAGLPTVSKVVATTVDQNTQLSFNTTDTSYFGVKKTASGYESFARAENKKDGNHAQFDNITINSGESFVLVNNWVDEDISKDFFEVHGYDSILGNRGFTRLVENSKFAKSTKSAPYYIYLSSTTNNMIYINEAISKTLTLNPGVWNTANATFQLYVGDSDGHGTAEWYPMSSSGGNFVVSVSNIPNGSVIIFCRMNPTQNSGDGLDWVDKNGYRVWNKTNDLNIEGGNTYSISAWGDGGTSPGSW